MTTTNSFQFDWKKSRAGDILRCVKCVTGAFTLGELYKAIGSKLMNDHGLEVSCTSAEFVFVGNTVDGSVPPNIARLMAGFRNSLQAVKKPVTTPNGNSIQVACQVHINAASDAEFLECIFGGANVGDWIICVEVDEDEENRYCENGVYCIQEDSEGLPFIVDQAGKMRGSSFSKFVPYYSPSKGNTHDIEVNCQIEQDDTPKQWEPDTIDPSVDIMKSIRDACRG